MYPGYLSVSVHKELPYSFFYIPLYWTYQDAIKINKLFVSCVNGSEHVPFVPMWLICRIFLEVTLLGSGVNSFTVSVYPQDPVSMVLRVFTQQII